MRSGGSGTDRPGRTPPRRDSDAYRDMPPRQLLEREAAQQEEAGRRLKGSASLAPSTLISVKQADEAVARAIRQTRLYSAKAEAALRRQVASLKEQCRKYEELQKEQQQYFLGMAQRQSSTMELQQRKLAELESKLTDRSQRLIVIRCW